MGGTPDANTRRLIVLERIEEELAAAGDEREPVLALAVVLARNALGAIHGPEPREVIRAALDAALWAAPDHPLVRAALELARRG